MKSYNHLLSALLIIFFIMLALATSYPAHFPGCHRIDVEKRHQVVVMVKDKTGKLIKSAVVKLEIYQYQFIESDEACSGDFDIISNETVIGLTQNDGYYYYKTRPFQYNWNIDKTIVSVTVSPSSTQKSRIASAFAEKHYDDDVFYFEIVVD